MTDNPNPATAEEQAAAEIVVAPVERATPAEQDERADRIIRTHVGLAAGGAAIPIPLVDLAAVTAVQLDMLKSLAENYGAKFDAQASSSFVTALTTAIGGSVLGRLGASAIKMVPGVGTLLGGAAQLAISGATTYAVGHTFKRLFREGRDFSTLDMNTVKDEAKEYFERGKNMAEDLLKKDKS